MKNKQKSFEETLKKLKEEDDQIPLKKWNEEIGSKLILLLPSMIFLLTFLKINDDKNIYDLIIFICTALFLVLGGVTLNFLLTKKNK
tara:strand:- start:13339 stop:13599 length:261 start_codon:yes stop_codon:yes gene_type:complete